MKKVTFLALFLFVFLPFLPAKESPPRQKIRPQFSKKLLDYTGAKDFQAFVKTSSGAMVASESLRASQVGVEIMKKGNIADAAVAVSFLLAVHKPESTGIGGGGFLLFYSQKKDRTYVIDMRERAPFKATSDMYVRGGKVIGHLSRYGGLAVATPGLVAGLYDLYRRFGSKKFTWAELLKPAIELAEKGFQVHPHMARAIAWISKSQAWKRFPATRQLLSGPDGTPLKKGDHFRNRPLARTLKKIAQKGPQAFYKGEIAKKIVESVQKTGGILTFKDLKEYRIKYRQPLRGRYRDLEIISMPPPSSGGIHLLQMANMVEYFNLGQWGFSHPQTIHLKGEVMKRAYADRAKHLGDPDFYKVPQKGLLSKKYAFEQVGTISLHRTRSSQKEIKAGDPDEASENTTHFSIVDSRGNAISSTQTINYYFGCGQAVQGTGIFLNNEMDDFAAQPGVPNIYGLVGSRANSIQPLKTPLSSMTPTIILKKGKVFMVLGSPGGSKIITSVFQVILNVTDHNMPLSQAVFSPRIHHQWLPDKLYIEGHGFAPTTLKALKKKGHKLEMRQTGMGCVPAILVHPETRERTGVADPRRGGGVAGE